jgi:hypothetical protein
MGGTVHTYIMCRGARELLHANVEGYPDGVHWGELAIKEWDSAQSPDWTASMKQAQ